MLEKFETLDRQWLLALSSDERQIVEVASRIHQRVVMEGGMWGGCYHLSFFLKRYLKKERDIDVKVVVGWVGEDSWRGVASHGWVEFGGRRIDISLTRTEDPQTLPTGDFILLDRVVLQGRAAYRYYREIPEQAKEAMIQLALNPESAATSKLAHGRHRQMLAMVDDEAAIDRYLDSVAGGMDYRSLALLAGLPLS
ncbi:MAG TPA: hypothetical protein DIT18_16495 [Pseudomonas sp.]|nr:hypothetical protein [Pseudomonas sp.]